MARTKRKLFTTTYKKRGKNYNDTGLRVPTKMKAAYVPSGFDTKKGLDRHIDNLTKKSIERMPKPSFTDAVPFVQNNEQKRKYRVRTRTGVEFNIGPIQPPASAHSSDDGKHAKIVHKVDIKTIIMGSDPVKEYSRLIETGRPSSKALLEAAKENGTTTKELFDTANSTSDDKLFFARKQLNYGTGFNQRGLTIYGSPAYTTYADIYDDLGLGLSSTLADFKAQEIYAAYLSSQTQIRLRNQSAHHRALVEVELYAFDPERSSIDEACVYMGQKVLYTDPTVIGNPDDKNRKIPRLMQYGPARLETRQTSPEGARPGTVLSCDYTTKLDPFKYSGAFKEAFMKVGKVGQVLGPGDFLNFRHVHHHGPGVNVNQIMAMKATDGATMERELHYVYMIKYKGSPCEVIYNVGGVFEARLGSSPVILNSEIRRRITHVNAPDEAGDILNTGVPTNVMLRAFTKTGVGNSLGRPDFNLPLEKWSTAATPADGFYAIQIASDRALRTDAHQSGNTNSTDIIP